MVKKTADSKDNFVHDQQKHQVFCAVLSGAVAKRGPSSPSGDNYAYASALIDLARKYADIWEQSEK